MMSVFFDTRFFLSPSLSEFSLSTLLFFNEKGTEKKKRKEGKEEKGKNKEEENFSGKKIKAEKYIKTNRKDWLLLIGLNVYQKRDNEKNKARNK